ncbi:MAG TPA: DNA lyase, partial [Bacteroidota bacterium]|nr:DNA lyase [Bacteroidota bacterium]
MKPKKEKISLDQLRDLYSAKRHAIRKRLEDFQKIPKEEYFYELVYCLLTPQSSAVNAGKAVGLLKERNFFETEIDPESLLHQKDFYVRFHKTKARHLTAMKLQFSLIARHLSNGSSSRELREWLIQNVKGLGRKEASHFLRNIGHKNLAILDRHILKNLVRVGALGHLPKTLTPKRYSA